MGANTSSTIARPIRKCGVSAPAAKLHLMTLAIDGTGDELGRGLSVYTADVVRGAPADGARASKATDLAKGGAD